MENIIQKSYMYFTFRLICNPFKWKIGILARENAESSKSMKVLNKLFLKLF